MNETHVATQRRTNHLPEAKIRRSRVRYLVWLVPIAAVALAAWWIYQDVARRGPTITIRFKDAKGLTVGQAAIKYRGATVGSVKSLRLSPDKKTIEVKAELARSAEGLAVGGSEFWIVRPEVSAAAIQGLMTIVSGEYIQVKPGSGAKQTEFTGAEEAPAVPVETPGLEVVLVAEKLGAVQTGSPVMYRGIKVGEVVLSELGPKAQVVNITARIEPEFAVLVRKNSKFWNAGGINMGIGLRGINLEANSLSTLVSGGISFATPVAMEAPAPNGTAFRLYDKADDQWLGWEPAISLPKEAGKANRGKDETEDSKLRIGLPN